MIADSPNEFANAVIELLRNSDLRMKCGENGFRRAQTEYQWGAIAKQYDTVYHSL
jgi:glycosyltransferase involved in cell wall biosynthesis